jgi:hypothetical protein
MTGEQPRNRVRASMGWALVLVGVMVVMVGLVRVGMRGWRPWSRQHVHLGPLNRTRLRQ